MRSLIERAAASSDRTSAASSAAWRWVRRQFDFSFADASTNGILATLWLAGVYLTITANVMGCGTPPRDLMMRLEKDHGLALDSIEAGVAAGHLDDKRRRDVVRAAEGQMNDQIAAADKLRKTPGERLADDSEPVTRFDAAKKRLDDELAAGRADAERRAAEQERRRNEFLNELLGAPSVKAAQR